MVFFCSISKTFKVVKVLFWKVVRAQFRKSQEEAVLIFTHTVTPWMQLMSWLRCFALFMLSTKNTLKYATYDSQRLLFWSHLRKIITNDINLCIHLCSFYSIQSIFDDFLHIFYALFYLHALYLKVCNLSPNWDYLSTSKTVHTLLSCRDILRFICNNRNQLFTFYPVYKHQPNLMFQTYCVHCCLTFWW